MLPVKALPKLVASSCLDFQVKLLKRQEYTVVVRDLRIANDDTFIQTHRLVKLKPWVLPNILNVGSFVRILSQNFTYQVDYIFTQEAGYQILAAQDFFVKFGGVRVFER